MTMVYAHLKQVLSNVQIPTFGISSSSPASPAPTSSGQQHLANLPHQQHILNHQPLSKSHPPTPLPTTIIGHVQKHSVAEDEDEEFIDVDDSGGLPLALLQQKQQEQEQQSQITNSSSDIIPNVTIPETLATPKRRGRKRKADKEAEASVRSPDMNTALQVDNDAFHKKRKLIEPSNANNGYTGVIDSTNLRRSNRQGSVSLLGDDGKLVIGDDEEESLGLRQRRPTRQASKQVAEEEQILLEVSAADVDGPALEEMEKLFVSGETLLSIQSRHDLRNTTYVMAYYEEEEKGMKRTCSVIEIPKFTKIERKRLSPAKLKAFIKNTPDLELTSSSDYLSRHRKPELFEKKLRNRERELFMHELYKRQMEAERRLHAKLNQLPSATSSSSNLPLSSSSLSLQSAKSIPALNSSTGTVLGQPQSTWVMNNTVPIPRKIVVTKSKRLIRQQSALNVSKSQQQNYSSLSMSRSQNTSMLSLSSTSSSGRSHRGQQPVVTDQPQRSSTRRAPPPPPPPILPGHLRSTRAAIKAKEYYGESVVKIEDVLEVKKDEKKYLGSSINGDGIKRKRGRPRKILV